MAQRVRERVGLVTAWFAPRLTAAPAPAPPVIRQRNNAMAVSHTQRYPPSDWRVSACAVACFPAPAHRNESSVHLRHAWVCPIKPQDSRQNQWRRFFDGHGRIPSSSSSPPSSSTSSKLSSFLPSSMPPS